jgi:hypothetical protein
LVEIAHDTDAFGARGPDGEADARQAVHDTQLGAQFLVDAVLFAFAEEIKIGLAQGGEEGIGVASARYVSLGVGDDEVVSVNVAVPAEDALEEAGLVDALELEGGPILFEDRLDLDAGGAGDESAHHNS